MIFFRKPCNASMVRGAIVLFFNETNILDNNFISTLSSWVQRSGYGWVRSPITYMFGLSRFGPGFAMFLAEQVWSLGFREQFEWFKIWFEWVQFWLDKFKPVYIWVRSNTVKYNQMSWLNKTDNFWRFQRSEIYVLLLGSLNKKILQLGNFYSLVETWRRSRGGWTKEAGQIIKLLATSRESSVPLI